MNTPTSSSSSSSAVSPFCYSPTTTSVATTTTTTNNHHNNLHFGTVATNSIAPTAARLRVFQSSSSSIESNASNSLVPFPVTTSNNTLSVPKYHPQPPPHHHSPLSSNLNFVVANSFASVYHQQPGNSDTAANSIIPLYEMPKMKKKAEAEPLLASPSHDSMAQQSYSTDNIIYHQQSTSNEPMVGSMFNHSNDSVDLIIDIEKSGPSGEGTSSGGGSTGLSVSPPPTRASSRKKWLSPTNAARSADTESIQSFPEDDDTALLQSAKPVMITRVQVQNGMLLNLFALIFVFLNMTLNLTVLAVIHERVPMSEPHLPDILFDFLPDVRRFLDITEYYIIVQMVSIFILLFFHKYRSIIFRRFCIIMGLIYFVRAICMASTQLPLASRNYTCSPQLKNSSDTANVTSLEFIGIIASRVFYMSLGMGLSINGHHNYCGDYIFSGHTVILVLTYLFFREYLLPMRIRSLPWRTLQVLQLAMTFFSIVCVVIARGHYFIDIIIAYFVTTRIFWIYHTLCTCNASNYKALSSHFHRLWWYQVFVYFENAKFITRPSSGKVEDIQQVQRVFEWPLPWPKRLARRKYRNQFTA